MPPEGTFVDKGPSPPTDRVVAVLDLLAKAGRGLTSSEIARRLALSNSTVAAILMSLDAAGYVERSADKSYRLGRGLLRLVGTLRARFPVLGAAEEELGGLAGRLGCGCTFTRIGADHLEVLLAAGKTVPAAGRSGPRFSLDPPYGYLAMAWRPPAEVNEWLARAPGDDADHHRRAIEGIRERGYAVFSMEPEAPAMAARLRELLAGEDATRDQLLRIAAVFARHAYTTEELESRDGFSVSYAIAPVFGLDGRPRYEIELHLMREGMSRTEVNHCTEELLRTACTLSMAIT